MLRAKEIEKEREKKEKEIQELCNSKNLNQEDLINVKKITEIDNKNSIEFQQELQCQKNGYLLQKMEELKEIVQTLKDKVNSQKKEIENKYKEKLDNEIKLNKNK